MRPGVSWGVLGVSLGVLGVIRPTRVTRAKRTPFGETEQKRKVIAVIIQQNEPKRTAKRYTFTLHLFQCNIKSYSHILFQIQEFQQLLLLLPM